MTSSVSHKPAAPWQLLNAGRTGASAGLATGEVLGGKYQIQALIAEGGMGVVKRATHLDLDCAVAIKLIRPEHAQNEDVVARLLAEARIAASLRSKHVNRVLDVGRTDAGLPYLVLEYLEGSDLASYLARCGRLPPREAVDYVLQACEALAEAHAVGIVHRDIKPENLFLSEDADGAFSLKVLDFGISKAPPARSGGRTLSSPFEIIGSPTYMSPEQIVAATVDARSDIWALGVVLYELCTGELLFAAASATETFAKILDAPASLAAFDALPCGAGLSKVVAKCLQRKPEERYQSVVELARALAPFADDALEPGRVAKVAAAARARMIAASADASRVPTLVTPIALTRSDLDIDVEQSLPSTEHASWQRWALIATAAAAIFAGVAFATRPRAALLAPPVAARAVPLPVSPAVADTPAQVVDAALVDTPALDTEMVAAPTAPRAKPAKAWIPPRYWLPKPAKPTPTPPPSSPSARPIPSQAPTVKPPVEPPPEPAPSLAADSMDAWNPKSFGGRR